MEHKKAELKPCPLCKGTNIIVERWSSGGKMYMVKCNNPDCPVPQNGYQTGRNLHEVKDEWNRRATNWCESEKKAIRDWRGNNE